MGTKITEGTILADHAKLIEETYEISRCVRGVEKRLDHHIEAFKSLGERVTDAEIYDEVLVDNLYNAIEGFKAQMDQLISHHAKSRVTLERQIEI